MVWQDPGTSDAGRPPRPPGPRAMSRTRRFMRGIGVGLVSQVVLAIVGLGVTRYLLHRLGQSEYGLWLVATQLLAYLALTDLGVIALLPREIAYATGRGAALA